MRYQVQKFPPNDAVYVHTLGERWADKVAAFGGSWTFIILFLMMMLTWIAINSWAFLFQPFDLYPYIFLNLVLSCIAALQAPIIMMSQNRQAAKDRVRAEKDYQINLKAEHEIQQLRNCLEKLSTAQQDHFTKLSEAINSLRGNS